MFRGRIPGSVHAVTRLEARESGISTNKGISVKTDMVVMKSGNLKRKRLISNNEESLHKHKEYYQWNQDDQKGYP